MKVIGIGEKKTLQPFISACDKFIYIEILKKNEPETEIKSLPNKKGKQPKTKETVTKIDNGLTRLLVDTIADLADENGWAFLGDLGNLILKKRPDFDSRNYSFTK